MVVYRGVKTVVPRSLWETTIMMIYVICLSLLASFVPIYGIPSYCHDYYKEFKLHAEYNKNIDPEINITISEKSYLYNIVEVR